MAASSSRSTGAREMTVLQPVNPASHNTIPATTAADDQNPPAPTVIRKRSRDQQTQATLDPQEELLVCSSLSTPACIGEIGFDALTTATYGRYIEAGLRTLEQQNRLQADFLANHSITPDNRRELVEWMLELCAGMGLQQCTSFLAVALVDQTLAKFKVPFAILNLVAVTSLLIASKYEEEHHPLINSLLSHTEYRYRYEHVVAMELKLLGTLDYSLSFASPLHFLHLYLSAASLKPTLEKCSKYLLELALPHYCMTTFSAPIVAAAAVYVSRMLAFKTPVWNNDWEATTQLTEAGVLECAQSLVGIVENEAKRQVLGPVSRKFSSAANLHVARDVLEYCRKS